MKSEKLETTLTTKEQLSKLILQQKTMIEKQNMVIKNLQILIQQYHKQIDWLYSMVVSDSRIDLNYNWLQPRSEYSDEDE